VEEVPPLARPIAGVGTSTAALIGIMDGVADPSILGTAVRLSAWQQFQDKFGPVIADPNGPQDVIAKAVKDHLFKADNRVLSLAVFGFFDNGGTECYVVAVAKATGLGSLTDPLKQIAPIDEVAIVAAPGVTAASPKAELVEHCSKLDDRFAVLDGLDVATATPAAVNGAAVGAGRELTYAGMYYPWIKLQDPLDPTKMIAQPPSGHIAGLYARVDSTRGVFKAPANETVIGARDVTQKLTKGDRETLNKGGINVIRDFGSSILVFGARTLGSAANTDFRYVSTRRYMNFLKESIDEGTQFVVFEPNSPALWQRVIRSVSDFLYNQWRDGALFGETPKQAFFVKCDADTNPASQRDLGILVTEIGVAIVKPAEFVVFRIQQITGS